MLAMTASLTSSSATEAASVIAKAAPALSEAATASASETVVATIGAVSEAVTLTGPLCTVELPLIVAVTALPIVFVTRLSAPATEIEIAETATLIAADTAVPVIDDVSDALTVRAPPPVLTVLPSIFATAESWIVLIALPPAMLTARPAPWLPIATLRLAATAVAKIVAWSVAITDREPAPTVLEAIVALTGVAMSFVATAPARATAPAPPLDEAPTPIAIPTGVEVIDAVLDALTTTWPVAATAL